MSDFEIGQAVEITVSGEQGVIVAGPFYEVVYAEINEGAARRQVWPAMCLESISHANNESGGIVLPFRRTAGQAD
jgi:hypothetical protein